MSGARRVVLAEVTDGDAVVSSAVTLLRLAVTGCRQAVEDAPAVHRRAVWAAAVDILGWMLEGDAPPAEMFLPDVEVAWAAPARADRRVARLPVDARGAAAFPGRCQWGYDDECSSWACGCRA